MMHRPKRKLKRRQLDIPRTLHAYEMRIRSLPRDKLQELEGAWVSSYDLWNTIPASSFEDEYEVRRDTINYLQIRRQKNVGRRKK